MNNAIENGAGYMTGLYSLNTVLYSFKYKKRH